MGIIELAQLIDELPRGSKLKDEVHDVIRYVDELKVEKEDLNNRNQELLGLLQDEQRRREDLNNRVQINRITGLPNHNKMAVDLEAIFRQDNQTQEVIQGAVLILRLDRSFSTIQSTLKPQMTEWILYQIAGRIRDVLKSNGQVYHSREDEFMILLTGIMTLKDYLSVGRNLRNEVRRPHVLSGYNIHLDCHIGIALFPQHGHDRGLLLQNADIALQVAQEKDKDIIIFYDALREQVIEKMDLQNSILKALEQQAINEIGKQFEIYYQPIIDIERAAEGEGDFDYGDLGSWKVRRVGAEALIRWHHPEKGLIAPDRFIPLAEETGLIIPIGNWIIYSVGDQIRQWKDRGLEIGPVSVNISPRQFQSETFMHTVRTAIQNNKLSSEVFRFEITETNLAQDPEKMIRTMWDLHQEGVYFYIDDFGTGYSSLSYVHQMPIKRIKIDRSFVLNLSSDEKREQTIIRTIIAMAKELGFGLVAEGVEELEQLRYLLEYDVTGFQGYHFSRPLTASAFEKFVQERKYLPSKS